MGKGPKVSTKESVSLCQSNRKWKANKHGRKKAKRGFLDDNNEESGLGSQRGTKCNNKIRRMQSSPALDEPAFQGCASCCRCCALPKLDWGRFGAGIWRQVKNKEKMQKKIRETVRPCPFSRQEPCGGSRGDQGPAESEGCWEKGLWQRRKQRERLSYSKPG